MTHYKSYINSNMINQAWSMVEIWVQRWMWSYIRSTHNTGYLTIFKVERSIRSAILRE